MTDYATRSLEDILSDIAATEDLLSRLPPESLIERAGPQSQLAEMRLALDARDHVADLCDLLREAGAEPFLHLPGCAMWNGEHRCDLECGPDRNREAFVRALDFAEPWTIARAL